MLVPAAPPKGRVRSRKLNDGSLSLELQNHHSPVLISSSSHARRCLVRDVTPQSRRVAISCDSTARIAREARRLSRTAGHVELADLIDPKPKRAGFEGTQRGSTTRTDPNSTSRDTQSRS